MALQKGDIVAAILFSLIGVSVESYNKPVKSSSTTCGHSERDWMVVYSKCSLCVLRGSSVELRSTYSYPRGETLLTSLWHLNWLAGSKEPTSVTNEPSYRNRVVNSHYREGQSTLTIQDLRESDSREYRFRIRTYSNRFTGAPGIIVTVTGLLVTQHPDPVTEGTFVTLTCNTNCTLSGSPGFVWYKNGQPSPSSVHNHFYLWSVGTGDSGNYSCAVQGKEELISPPLIIDIRYAPKNISAHVYPSGEIAEGASVILVCSSIARPPADQYSWFRRSGTGSTRTESAGQNYSIPGVSGSHSGEYFCSARNTIGENTSAFVTLNVTYPPRRPKTVVSPSGDVVEGTTMTLTCSSEANPVVHTYSWYWRSGAHSFMLGVGQNYSIPNMTCQNSGEYHCQAENLKGATNSSVFVRVLYPPRKVLVSVSSLDGVVTLSCSSEANPVANHYSWHKRTGTDATPRGTGRNLTLDPGESGLYYCKAKNELGASESNLLPISEENTAVKYAAAVIVAIGALVVFTIFFLRIRNKKTNVPETTEATSDNEQEGSGPVYENVPRVSVTSGLKSIADTESEIHYTSVYFKQCDTQKVPLYSTLEKPKLPLVEDEVLYSTVKSH